jgi:hypothetical protein
MKGAGALAGVVAAIVPVRQPAAASGHHLAVPKSGGSAGRDRLTIAAAATAGIALIAAFVLYRGRERPAAT